MSGFGVIAIKRLVMLAVLNCALGGCGGNGRWMSYESQPVEPNAYPANHKPELLDFMRTFLDDPTNVRDAYVTEPFLMSFDGQNHYAVCVRYNAKVDGKYVGIADKIAIYYGGKINQFIRANPDQCGKAAYEPFPELEQLKRLGK